MAAVLAVRPNGLLGRAQEPTRPVEAPRAIRPMPPRLRALGAALILLAAGLPLVLPPYALAVLTETLILMLFAASLHVIMGPGGMPSFGHAAFFGIGAYAAGLLVRDGGAGMTPALLTALVGAGAAAAAVRRGGGAGLGRVARHAHPRLRADPLGRRVPMGGLDRRRQRHHRRLAPRRATRPGASSSPSPGSAASAAPCCCAASFLALRLRAAGRAGHRDAGGGCRSTGRGAPAGRLDDRRRCAALAGGLYAFLKGSVFPTYLGIPISVEGPLMVLFGGIGTSRPDRRRARLRGAVRRAGAARRRSGGRCWAPRSSRSFCSSPTGSQARPGACCGGQRDAAHVPRGGPNRSGRARGGRGLVLLCPGDARPDRAERRRQEHLFQHGGWSAPARARERAAGRGTTSPASRPRAVWRTGSRTAFQVAAVFASMTVQGASTSPCSRPSAAIWRLGRAARVLPPRPPPTLLLQRVGLTGTGRSRRRRAGAMATASGSNWRWRWRAVRGCF